MVVRGASSDETDSQAEEKHLPDVEDIMAREPGLPNQAEAAKLAATGPQKEKARMLESHDSKVGNVSEVVKMLCSAQAGQLSQQPTVPFPADHPQELRLEVADSWTDVGDQPRGIEKPEAELVFLIHDSN